MKLFILCSLLAIAAASPVDLKTPLNPPQSALDINKPTPPLVETRKDPHTPINKPLFKRDSPVDPKTNAQQPSTNAHKNAQVPTPTVTDTKTNKRPSRDAPSKPIDSYKPQPSGVPQKNAQTPSHASSDAAKTHSNVHSSRDSSKTSINTENTKKVETAPPAVESASKNTNSNTRPKRETPKAPISNQEPPKQLNTKSQAKPEAAKVTPNNRPSRETQKTPVASAQKPTENSQKNAAPAPSSTNSKNQQRVTRDAPKPAENNNQKPVTWNKDEKKVENKPQAQADRKTRETPKKEVLKDDKAKTTITIAHPEVSKVPLTNSRNRRDAPNPHEQSKLVPSGAISGNPALKARDDSTTQAPRIGSNVSSIKRESEKQASGIHYPVPVSEVLKKKESENKPAAATNNSKPDESSNKKQ